MYFGSYLYSINWLCFLQKHERTQHCAYQIIARKQHGKGASQLCHDYVKGTRTSEAYLMPMGCLILSDSIGAIIAKVRRAAQFPDPNPASWHQSDHKNKQPFMRFWFQSHMQNTVRLLVSTVLIQSICQSCVTGGLKSTKFWGVTGHRAHWRNHQVKKKLGLEIDFFPL